MVDSAAPLSVISTGRAQTFEDYVQLQAAAAEFTRQSWNSLDELQRRIQELEAELQVWKLGHREAVKAREEAQRTVRDLNGEPIVLCVLDGDGAIFNRQYISQGRDGGREAALALHSHVTNLADQTLGRTVTVVVQIFYNKAGLSRVLQDVGIATEPVFAAFVQGLNAAHPLIVMTDVGSQKEAADAKLREAVRLHCKLPSCKLVIAGCEHDGGYSHLLQSLETEGLSDKIRILKSFDEGAFDIKRLNLNTVQFPGLFEPKKLVSYAQQSGSIKRSTTPGNSATKKVVTVAATPAVVVEQNLKPSKASSSQKPPLVHTPSHSSHHHKTSEDKENGFTKVVKLRAIDPSKPFSKQTPPICNSYYLKGQCKRHDCPFAHDFKLSPKQLATLRADAKKSPCIDALKGKSCPKECIAGHRCPHQKCPYGGPQGSCKFKARGMHPGEPGYAAASAQDDDADFDDPY